MFLKLILVSLCSLLLIGCKEAVLSNELSERYKLNKDFFSSAYNNLKVKDTLFYIDVGYFEEKQNNLIIFLLYNSLYFNEVFLDKVELIVDEKVVDIVAQLKVDEIEEFIGGKKYAKGGVRLVFNVSDAENLLGDDLKLKIYFKDEDSSHTNVYIPIMVKVKRIWPT